MDAQGAWCDNFFIERLWHSLKYECVYLDAFHTVRDAKRQIGTKTGGVGASATFSGHVAA